MGTVLSEEVRPAVYTETPEMYQEPLRDEVVAQLAGISVSQMVELETRHYEGIKVETFTLPTLIDGTKVCGYRGWNDVSIPGKTTAPRGGLRSYQYGGRLEVQSLVDGMDTKFSIYLNKLIEVGVVDPDTEIPVGGKGEIVFPIDPRRCTPGQKATAILEYTRVLDDAGFFSKGNHRMGPDMNMNSEDMALIRDELLVRGYSKEQANSWITSLPIESGGVAGRQESTARGWATVTDEYLRLLQVPEGTEARFSIQGFGAAGSPLIDQFNEVSNYKGILVCVSDQYGTIYSSKGIDPKVFKDIIYASGSHGGQNYMGVLNAGVLYRNMYDHDSSVISNAENPDAWLEVPADCYVPAALANAINMNNVHKLIKSAGPGFAKFVLPQANSGVATPAQVELEKYGIRTAHHAHLNSHGAIASLVQSAFARGAFRDENPKNTATVYRVIDQIGRSITRELFDLSNQGSIAPTASLAAAADAQRVKVLKSRFA